MLLSGSFSVSVLVWWPWRVHLHIKDSSSRLKDERLFFCFCLFCFVLFASLFFFSFFGNCASKTQLSNSQWNAMSRRSWALERCSGVLLKADASLKRVLNINYKRLSQSTLTCKLTIGFQISSSFFISYWGEKMSGIQTSVVFLTSSIETTYNDTTMWLDSAYFPMNVCMASAIWTHYTFWRRIFHAVNKWLHSHSLTVKAWPLSTATWPWGEKWVWNPCADGNRRRKQFEGTKTLWRRAA